MRDPESRNAIAVAPSSALQTHTNASWHLSSPGKRTARAAGSSSSSQQKTIRGHGWGLKFGTAAATRHKLLAIPTLQQVEAIKVATIRGYCLRQTTASHDHSQT